MKIGILTFHRALNPGAVLQCYALQETLKILGYDVKVINYYQPYIEYVYSPFKKDIFKSLLFKPRKLFGYLRRLPFYYLNNKPYRTFIKKYIDTTFPIKNKDSIPESFDVYIIGSDQLWGLQCTKDIDEVYMGDFKHKSGSKVIGYAISSNLTSLERIGNDNLNKYICNFDSISFRESIIKDKIFDLTGKKSDTVLDPTFLLEVSSWEKFQNKKFLNKRYIFKCMFLNDETKKNDLDESIQKLSEDLGCEIFDFYKHVKSPEDFLSIIKSAQYIITSSFHAVAFSLIFRKQIYAISLDNGYDERYKNLLLKIGAVDSIVKAKFEYNGPTINYDLVSKNIEDEKASSLDYLISSLRK